MVYFGRISRASNDSPEEKAKARRLQVEKSYQLRQSLISVGSGGLMERAGTAASRRPALSAAGSGP